MKKILILSSIIFLSGTAFAADDNHYRIVTDAGSSGTRFHVFQYSDGKTLPQIKDIFAVSKDKDNKKLPALSSFATHPQDAGAGLKPGFDSISQYLIDHQIDAKSVNIDIMGTAGMRLLPSDQQAAIYRALTQYISENYSFKPKQLRTLEGKEEALFGWLDVNYLNENFQRNTDTTGSLDMGGASTQIAYELNSAADALTRPDTYYLQLGSRAYAIYAKSYLGLGQDQARASMMKDANASACFPVGYQDAKNNPPINGNFSQTQCGNVYQTIIKQNAVAKLPTPKNNRFLAYSAYYFGFSFFGIDRTPSPDLLTVQINSICSETWDELKKDFPKESEKFLSADCANGTYINTLLYSVYGLNKAKLSSTNQINGTDIDWTLGALIFALTQNK